MKKRRKQGYKLPLFSNHSYSRFVKAFNIAEEPSIDTQHPDTPHVEETRGLQDFPVVRHLFCVFWPRDVATPDRLATSLVPRRSWGWRDRRAWKGLRRKDMNVKQGRNCFIWWSKYLWSDSFLLVHSVKLRPVSIQISYAQFIIWFGEIRVYQDIGILRLIHSLNSTRKLLRLQIILWAVTSFLL